MIAQPWGKNGSLYAAATGGVGRFVLCVCVAANIILIAWVYLRNTSELHPPSSSLLFDLLHPTATEEATADPPAEPMEHDNSTIPTQIFELPELDDFELRGVWANEFAKRPPLYPLDPFPPSPMPADQEEGTHNPWLGAVIVSAFDIKVRMLIRYTWMTLYKDVPMDRRFVIANPGPAWSDMIQRENRSYGDLIVLDRIQEDDFTANSIKTMEFFRYLSEDSPRKYEIVTKIDTDLWLDARNMWNRHIRPLLSEELKLVVKRTFVGQFYYEPRYDLAFPHGALYTATWDLVELLPKLHKRNRIVRNEDMLVGWLLVSAKERVNFRVISQAEKFNFFKGDQRRPNMPWARKDTDLTARGHGLAGKDVIAVHRLKTEQDWMMVADCFDEQGLKDKPVEVEGLEDEGPRPNYNRPWYEGIPDNHWDVDGDGRTVCNGVYTLEPGVGKDLKMRG